MPSVSARGEWPAPTERTRLNGLGGRAVRAVEMVGAMGKPAMGGVEKGLVGADSVGGAAAAVVAAVVAVRQLTVALVRPLHS